MKVEDTVDSIFKLLNIQLNKLQTQTDSIVASRDPMAIHYLLTELPTVVENVEIIVSRIENIRKR